MPRPEEHGEPEGVASTRDREPVAEVVIAQKSLRRYREPFYESLRERLDEVGVRLRVVEASPDGVPETRGTQGHLSWVEQASARSFRLGDRDVAWQSLIGPTRGADLVIVEQASQLLANYLLLARQWVGGPRVAYWGHGRHHGQWRPHRVAETLRRLTSTRAHWWFAYTDGSADAVEALGYPRERITVVRNSTDTDRMRSLVESTTREDVERLRAELGLEARRLAVYLGSLTWDKRLPFVFEAADHVRSSLPEFELVVVGEGDRWALVEGLVAERPWTRMVGTRFDRDLAVLLSMAAAVLVPAAAGLAVVDSLAAGVPLVASSSFGHSPEIEYLEDGRNGLVVDDDRDPARYGAAIVRLLRDEELHRRLVVGCHETAATLGIQQMVERFATGVQRALAR